MSQLGQQGSRGQGPGYGKPRPIRKNGGASQKVLAYLRERANTEIPYAEITKELGYDNTHVVSNAIQNLRDKGINIDRPMRGMAIYRTGPVAAPIEIIPQFPRPTPINKMWEEVGTAGEAGIIVRDEYGNLGLVRAIKEILT